MRPGRARRRERLAIQLFVRVTRDGVDGHERGRDHVRRQCPGQRPPQLAHGGPRVRAEDDVRDEAALARVVLPVDHRRFAHPAHAPEDELDLEETHLEISHLDH